MLRFIPITEVDFWKLDLSFKSRLTSVVYRLTSVVYRLSLINTEKKKTKRLEAIERFRVWDIYIYSWPCPTAYTVRWALMSWRGTNWRRLIYTEFPYIPHEFAHWLGHVQQQHKKNRNIQTLTVQHSLHEAWVVSGLTLVLSWICSLYSITV